MTFPALATMIALPALAALSLPDARGETGPSLLRARALAVGALASSLAIAVHAVLAFHPELAGAQESEFLFGWLGLRTGPRLAVDAIVLPLLPTTLVLALAGILGAPRTVVHGALRSTAAGPRLYRAVLLTCSATLLLQCAADLDTFVVGWVASLLPGWFLLRPESDEPDRARGLRRLLGIYFALGTAPLLVATGLLHLASAKGGPMGPVLLYAQKSLGLSTPAQEWILVLLGLSVVARKGMFPLHSWVPALVERGSVAVGTQILGAHAGVLLLLRLALPLLPEASRVSMWLIAGAAFVSALHGATAALGERNLRRTLGLVAVSQSSLILAGVTTMNPAGVSGALLQCIGFSLALAGVLWAAHFVEVRTGTLDMGRLGGLAGKAPLAAGLFLVCAAALVGLPGSIGFVSDDLLIHGVLTARPAGVLLLLGATALNAITLFRAYVSTFLGRPRGRERTLGPVPIPDLLPRERWLLVGLLVLMVGGGTFPGVLLDLRAHGVSVLLGHGVVP
jgi:NADH-quinone oxidoreductase subunit M